MNLRETVMNWANRKSIKCNNCNHPAGKCSGGCFNCLDEIHFWHRNPKRNRRTAYNCRKLALEYIKKYTAIYCENIISACDDINLSKYNDFRILSIGCGMSPDLMAFEEIAEGKSIYYVGIDNNTFWEEFRGIIHSYIEEENIDVDFEIRDALTSLSSRRRQNIYNVAVLQFVISGILSAGERKGDILNMFHGLIDGPVLRWYNSDETSPFLFILNDADSVWTGRKHFYDLLDMLVYEGYEGRVFAQSGYIDQDLGDRQGRLFKGFDFDSSSYTNNNSATLVIEVEK